MQKTARRRSSSAVQNPLETYLKEINETALLSAEEERELSNRIEHGDKEARDRMVRANLRLVVNIARAYSGRQPGTVESRRRLRSRDGNPLQYLCQLLDQAVDQAGSREFCQDNSYSGLHGRTAYKMASRYGTTAGYTGSDTDD